MINGSPATPRDHEILTILFDLGRQVTSVLDFDELVEQIPRLIGRLIPFDAFAVYLLDDRRAELRAAYAVGYAMPTERLRLKLGSGLVSAAVTTGMPLLVNDLQSDRRYVEYVPGMASTIVVPLTHKARAIGALNVLGRNRDQFTQAHVQIVRQFAAHVAV